MTISSTDLDRFRRIPDLGFGGFFSTDLRDEPSAESDSLQRRLEESRSQDGLEMGSALPPEAFLRWLQQIDPSFAFSPGLIDEIRRRRQELGSSEGRQDSLRAGGAGAPGMEGFDADLLQMLIDWLERRNDEIKAKPAPRPVGSLPSSSGASGTPSSWGGSGGTGGSGGHVHGSGGAAPSSSTTQGARAANGAEASQNPLKGKDKETAKFIDKHLEQKGSPAAEAKSPSAGEMMVQAGKKHGVDPMVLLAISAHETGHGTLGVGMQKMLGVSAYDSNPSNVNPKFDGLRNQIFEGAETFARLREKGGASANDPIEAQLKAANRGGWATDPNWHAGVGRNYDEITQAATKFAKEHDIEVAHDGGAPKADAASIAKIPNYHQLAPALQRAALDAVHMGLTVTSTTTGGHSPSSYHYPSNNPDGKGHAIDVAGSPDKMAAFYRKYASRNPKELFHDPIGGIKNGQQIGAIGGHGDHVHMAL